MVALFILKCAISSWETGSSSDLIALKISIQQCYRVCYQEHPVISLIWCISFFIGCWLCFDLLFRLLNLQGCFLKSHRMVFRGFFVGGVSLYEYCAFCLLSCKNSCEIMEIFRHLERQRCTVKYQFFVINTYFLWICSFDVNLTFTDVQLLTSYIMREKICKTVKFFKITAFLYRKGSFAITKDRKNSPFWGENAL